MPVADAAVNGVVQSSRGNCTNLVVGSSKYSGKHAHGAQVQRRTAHLTQPCTGCGSAGGRACAYISFILLLLLLFM